MIWDCIMFRDETDMLECRLEEFAEAHCDTTHIVTESRHTHRGIPKPLNFPVQAFAGDPGLRYIIDDFAPDPDPWLMEHHQRDQAWKTIDAEADDGDVVLICDVDEIPSAGLLAFLPEWAAHPESYAMSVTMRTCLFAADWLVDTLLPPTCVAATVRFLRQRAADGEYLAGVRDSRENYPQFGGGGWHLSWLGGPDAQRDKLLSATCHTELLSSPEGTLIAGGERYRTARDGGGLPVIPVDVDETWPRFICERRCPASWFRPRGEDDTERA